jgi:hypothetical protein
MGHFRTTPLNLRTSSGFTHGPLYVDASAAPDDEDDKRRYGYSRDKLATEYHLKGYKVVVEVPVWRIRAPKES